MDTIAGQKKAVLALRKKMLERPNKLSILQQQKMLNTDKPARGPIWVSRFEIPAPRETDLEELFWRSVQDLNPFGDNLTRPTYHPSLLAQWTGPRAGAGPKDGEPAISEPAKYENLMKEVQQDSTIFLLHGGSFVFGGPVTVRPLATTLSAATKSRVLSVSYRVAPQHTFPAPLLDVLVAYFSLLSPSPASHHKPVPASKIVLAGESAGATLQLGLLQVLLRLRRQGHGTINFNGRVVPVDLPAAIACISAPADWTMSLPSCSLYGETDWSGTLAPWHHPGFPADSVWPSLPPRGEAYVEASGLTHPLLSVAALEDWAGAPRMFFCTGYEAQTDGMSLIAQTAARQGVEVEFLQYEGMPHLWFSFLPVPQAGHVLRECARFCGSALGGQSKLRHAPNGRMFKMGDTQPVELDIKALAKFSRQEAKEMMEQGRQRRMTRVWNGPIDQKAKATL